MFLALVQMGRWLGFDLEIVNRVLPLTSYLARGPTVGRTSVFHQLFS